MRCVDSISEMHGGRSSNQYICGWQTAQHAWCIYPSCRDVAISSRGLGGPTLYEMTCQHLPVARFVVQEASNTIVPACRLLASFIKTIVPVVPPHASHVLITLLPLSGRLPLHILTRRASAEAVHCEPVSIAAWYLLCLPPRVSKHQPVVE